MILGDLAEDALVGARRAREGGPSACALERLPTKAALVIRAHAKPFKGLVQFFKDKLTSLQRVAKCKLQ